MEQPDVITIAGPAKRRRDRLSRLLLVLLGLGGLFYIVNNLEDFVAVANRFSWRSFIVVLFFSFGLLYFRGLLVAVLIAPFQVHLKPWEYLGLASITSMANYLLPAGGIVLRATYLKRVHSFSYAEFLSTLLGAYPVIFLTNTIIALGTLFLLPKQTVQAAVPLIAFLLLLLGACLLFFLGSKYLRPSWLNRSRVLSQALKGWQLITSDYGLILRCSALVLLLALCNTAVTYAGFRAFDIQVPLLHAMTITSIGLLAIWFNVTPGSLGVLEAMVTLTSTVFKIKPAEALMMTALSRLAMVILSFTLGPIFSYFLMRAKPDEHQAIKPGE